MSTEDGVASSRGISGNDGESRRRTFRFSRYKAETNKDQALYFEAMREARLRRAMMEGTFRRELDERMHAKLSCAEKAGTDSKGVVLGGVKLMLVGKR